MVYLCACYPATPNDAKMHHFALRLGIMCGMEPVENAVGYTSLIVGSLFNRGGLGVVHAAPEPPGAFAPS